MGDLVEDNEAAVRAIYRAFRDRDRTAAETLLAESFTFTSPYDDAISRAQYFARCWPNGDLFRDFQIKRVSGDADGAFITYLVTAKDGTSFRNTEYLRVEDGRITSVDVYFGASYRGGKFQAKQEKIEG